MIDEPTTMSSGVEVLLNVRYQAISAAPQSVWFWPVCDGQVTHSAESGTRLLSGALR